MLNDGYFVLSRMLRISDVLQAQQQLATHMQNHTSGRSHAAFNRLACCCTSWRAGMLGSADLCPCCLLAACCCRYRDVTWLRKERRWPPALTDSLQALLQLKSV
jgi:hypothetical protein